VKLSSDLRIPLQTAEARALACLDRETPRVASSVADFIWPEHRMTGQGAGAAASRILVGLRKRGAAAWICRHGSWGWTKR
jgi:hypothetical protein